MKKHEADFNKDAWKEYSAEELYWWVHLLAKRALHRIKGEKRDKDIYDAENYLGMYKSYLENFKIEVTGHPNVINLEQAIKNAKEAN